MSKVTIHDVIATSYVSCKKVVSMQMNSETKAVLVEVELRPAALSSNTTLVRNHEHKNRVGCLLVGVNYLKNEEDSQKP